MDNEIALANEIGLPDENGPSKEPWQAGLPESHGDPEALPSVERNMPEGAPHKACGQCQQQIAASLGKESDGAWYCNECWASWHQETGGNLAAELEAGSPDEVGLPEAQLELGTPDVLHGAKVVSPEAAVEPEASSRTSRGISWGSDAGMGARESLGGSEEVPSVPGPAAPALPKRGSFSLVPALKFPPGAKDLRPEDLRKDNEPSGNLTPVYSTATPRTEITPRSARSPRTDQSSLVELSPRLIKQQKMDQAMKAHLFGGKAPDAESRLVAEKPRMSLEERKSILKRIQEPLKRRPAAPDPQCTFQPQISEHSRELADANNPDAVPSFMLPLPEKKVSNYPGFEEVEFSKCTFVPVREHKVQDKFADLQPKFLQSGYERYQNKKKAHEKTIPEQESKEAGSPQQNSGPGSPNRKNPFKGSPSSPGFKGPSPQSPRHGEAMDVHVARTRAAREEKIAREAKSSKLAVWGSVNDAQWQNRSGRSTTTPVPFYSHSGHRVTRRQQIDEERAMVKTGEVDKVFQELHEQLHSLELGGPASWPT